MDDTLLVAVLDWCEGFDCRTVDQWLDAWRNDDEAQDAIAYAAANGSATIHRSRGSISWVSVARAQRYGFKPDEVR